MEQLGNCLVFLNQQKKIPLTSIGLNITRGTKIMSLACDIEAMGFCSVSPDILYLDNKKFYKELRRPVPGTQILNIIENLFKFVNEIFEDRGLDYEYMVV